MFRKTDDWQVNGFIIKPRELLGQGAYGVVFKAVDSKGNNVAAKRIKTGDRHPLPNIVRDTEKLKQLNHPNIVKVHDIHQEENIVWIFMELCEHGDLNTFYRKRKFTNEQGLAIMTQIAAGVQCLHRNDVVHRDIKPENVLVSSDSPIEVKLTDFDVSKFFDEFYDTSAMHSDVGTLAFKAPEFFKRTPEGHLVYHRNVDVYAMGLVFLALLQVNTETKQLKPQIETPQEDDEKFSLSIGQLIAERVKYKVKELRVVAVDNSASEGAMSEVAKLAKDVRVLIQKMTSVDPEERISATDVHKIIFEIKKVMS